MSFRAPVEILKLYARVSLYVQFCIYLSSEFLVLITFLDDKEMKEIETERFTYFPNIRSQ